MSLTQRENAPSSAVIHRRLWPSRPLREYVRSYEYVEAPAADIEASPFAVSVLPLLSFRLRSPGTAFEYAEGRARVLPPAIALGPCDHRVADVSYTGHLMNFTIVFEPAGFFRLFHVSPFELRNHAYDVRDVLGERVARLHARLLEAASPEQMASIVEAVLLADVVDAEPCSRMQRAADVLLETKGRSELAEVAHAAGLSARSWRRHFVSEIGVAPKRYLRMLRMRHAIVLKRMAPARSWTQIGLEAGYYDQSHLIAEFRAMGGSAPSDFMRELAGVPDIVAGAVYGSTGADSRAPAPPRLTEFYKSAGAFGATMAGPGAMA
jgi:AraC-like DNA-binding protein